MDRLISANDLKETLVETLESIKASPKMDGQEIHIIAATHALIQMIDDAPTIWAGDENDLSFKILDDYEREKLFEYQSLGHNIDHLRKLVEAEKNEPLSLEELRKMDGEPVYLSDLCEKDGIWEGWIVFTSYNQYGFIPRGGGLFSVAGYGKTWLAYRRKPEEGNHV